MKYGDGMLAQLWAHHHDICALRAVPGGGYLLAAERAHEVNQLFIAFLRELDGGIELEPPAYAAAPVGRASLMQDEAP